MDSKRSKEKTSKEKWQFGETVYEGFPLLLRSPLRIDFSQYQKRLSQLLTVTHHLAMVQNSGLPEPEYHLTLQEMDHAIIMLFSKDGNGRTVLIETFAGKRNYYLYVSPVADLESAKARFSSKFPDATLEWELRSDPEWKFIKRYNRDFKLW